MAVEIHPVRAGDAAALVAKMRQADVDELAALGHTNLLPLVEHSIACSAFCYTARADERMVAIFGVCPGAGLFDPIGVPWMLGTDRVRHNQRALMRLCRPYISGMLQAYPHLVNQVHADNTAAVRWLKCVGFTLQPAAPVGPYGALFHRFDMRA